MIGSIIQAVKGHFKDTASIADKWTKESMKDKESKDIEKSVDEAQKKVEESATENQETPNTTQEPTETETVEQTTETTETVPDKKNDTSKSFSILSDEESKDITTGDDGKDITGQKPSSGTGSKGGTAGMVLNIVNSVRKDLQNVGKSISSKGGSGSRIFGENTYNTLAPIVKAKYSSKVSDTSAPTSSSVPSDAQLKFVDGEESPNVCLKQFFYDDDNNSFHDPDILNAYKNLQAIEFTYKPEATEIDPTQDTETVHVGLKAQDIEAQPELASAVKEDPESGYKVVDTREMTMQNAAAISEIAKLLDELKTKVEQLGG